MRIEGEVSLVLRNVPQRPKVRRLSENSAWRTFRIQGAELESARAIFYKPVFISPGVPPRRQQSKSMGYDVDRRPTSSRVCESTCLRVWLMAILEHLSRFGAPTIPSRATITPNFRVPASILVTIGWGKNYILELPAYKWCLHISPNYRQ